MSTAAAAPDAAAQPKGKKKLLIIIVAVVLLVVVGAGAALMMKKKSQADDGEDGDAEHAAPAKAAVKHDPKAVPTFVPLDPFTVNLADREAERYAQVGITLEVADAKVGDQIKAYMPAIRNNILMALAEKSATQLMDREGKAKLAEQVKRETSRAMGYEVEDPEEEGEEAPKPKKGKKKKKAAAPELPITGVHFSNFIIQ
ncbi:MAG: flagellar basal body-associated FliL family protein [Rubrivivax sp.]